MDNPIELIRTLNRSGKKLSKSQKRIADCIMSHPDKVVFMTAAKLGVYAGVSESTVVRFAVEIGYKGYPQLQKSLQEIVRQRLTVSERFDMTDEMDCAQTLDRVLKADMRNIRTTLNEIDLNDFDRTVDAIIEGRRVYVMGLRSCAPIAEFFGHYLKYILPRVNVVTSGVCDVFEQLSDIGPGDVLIGISFPHYTQRSIEAMRFAKEQGAFPVAITDSLISPMKRYSDVCLLARSDMSSFVDSFAAPLSLINALVVALGQRRKTEAASYLSRMDEIWSHYNVYMTREMQ